ncbi:MAG: radical SAM protein [Chromatiaceae bacterium]
MGYRDHIAKTWDRAILSSVLVELGYRCNLDCVICYNDRAQPGIPLSREDYFRLLDDLAALGVLTLTLSGGEPLLHPDFWAIGGRARALGFVVRIKSNGHALGRQAAHRLREEIDPFMVELSLHGATPATHDRQTQVPGSFARLLANARTLLAVGQRIKFNCPLTTWNEGETAAMFALAEGLGVTLSVDTRLTPRDDGDTSPLDLAPSVAGIRGVLDRQRAAAAARQPQSAAPDEALSREGSCHHCGAGASTLAVDPIGNVYPCVQWRRAIGNLHERTVAELWRGSQELERVRAVTAAVKAQFAAWPEGERPAGFCPALAEQRTGSPLKLDPEIQRRMLAMGATAVVGPTT